MLFYWKPKKIKLLGDFEVGRGSEAIAHLQFVDDTILFSSSKWEETIVLKRILRCFELTSGLKVNIQKSTLVGWIVLKRC